MLPGDPISSQTTSYLAFELIAMLAMEYISPQRDPQVEETTHTLTVFCILELAQVSKVAPLQNMINYQG